MLGRPLLISKSNAWANRCVPIPRCLPDALNLCAKALLAGWYHHIKFSRCGHNPKHPEGQRYTNQKNNLYRSGRAVVRLCQKHNPYYAFDTAPEVRASIFIQCSLSVDDHVTVHMGTNSPMSATDFRKPQNLCNQKPNLAGSNFCNFMVP